MSFGISNYPETVVLNETELLQKSDEKKRRRNSVRYIKSEKYRLNNKANVN